MRHPSRRPPWWPSDEAWPPHGPPRRWRTMRGRLMGFVFALFVLFSVSCALTLAWAITALLNVMGQPSGGSQFPVIDGRVLLAVFLFGVLGVPWALRRVATPFGDLVEAVGRVADGDYTVRVAEHGPRSLRSLLRAFNTMTTRLQTSDAQRRHLMADVAHELRTPLTVMQGNLEGLLDGVYPRDDAHLTLILEETRVLSRLIDDLRTLALSESGALKLQKELTDLAILLNEVLLSFQTQAAASGVSLQPDLARDMPLCPLDPTRIREVLANLIANALRYTPRGGVIRVTAAFDAATQKVIVRVSDSGAGIAPADLPHIFDRFYKARDSHGSGLGLTIARNLISAHGGELTAHSELGQGTTMQFTLPCTSDTAD